MRINKSKHKGTSYTQIWFPKKYEYKFRKGTDVKIDDFKSVTREVIIIERCNNKIVKIIISKEGKK